MTAVANQYGYWQTGNFANDFKAPAQQAPISQDRNTGREGYGYQYYSPGKWGRDGWNKWAFNASCLFSSTTPSIIVNHSGTSVAYQGGIAYRITKPGGASAFDSDAVSTASAAGDFTLKLSPLVSSGIDIIAGVNSDPLTDSTYTGIDYSIYLRNDGQIEYYESGTSVPSGGITYNDTLWIVRSGTTLTYRKGADVSTATVLRTVNGVSSTLYFDSSFFTPSSSLDVEFNILPVPTSLAADSGIYALTGTATALRVARNQVEAVGSYTLAGTATALRIARKQVEAVGSYTLSGTATGLAIGHKVAAAVGSYSLSGTATGLRKGFTLAGAAGSYTVSGQTVALRVARSLAATPGSYAISGVGPILRVTLPVPVGSYTITGQTVIFRVAMPSAVGSYTITGTPTVLRVAKVLAEAVGSYAISGQSVTLTYGAGAKILTAAVGSYSLSGVSTVLRASRRLSGAIGSYSYTGITTGLRVARRLVAAPGTYSIVGIGPVLGTVLPIASGSYALSGVSVNLRRAARLPVLVGAYALTGLAAFLSATRRLGVSQGAYVITGTTSLLRLGRGLGVVPGSYILTGYDADLRTNDVVLRLNVGSYVLTGTALGFIKTVAVPPSRIVAPSSVTRLVQPSSRELVAQAARVGRVVSPSRRLA